MQQVLIVLEKAEEDEHYLQEEGNQDPAFLIRTPTGKGPRFRWKEHLLGLDPRWGEAPYLVDASPDSRKALSRLPEASQELQLEVFMLPAPVKERGSRGYFPFVLLLVDAQSGLVTGVSMLSPQPDLRSMYESLPQHVINKLIELGHRPSKIRIQTDLLFDLLEELLETAGCQVEWVDQMPEMDEAVGALLRDYLS
jgi:hypothetical protein